MESFQNTKKKTVEDARGNLIKTSDAIEWDPTKEIIKDARQNHIKTYEDLEWDTKEETTKDARWNHIRTVSKQLTTLNGTQKKTQLLWALIKTFSKTSSNHKWDPKKET